MSIKEARVFQPTPQGINEWSRLENEQVYRDDAGGFRIKQPHLPYQPDYLAPAIAMSRRIENNFRKPVPTGADQHYALQDGSVFVNEEGKYCIKQPHLSYSKQVTV